MQEAKARQAEKDPLFFIKKCTKTKDEQDLSQPYKPFPDRDYFRYVYEFLENEPIAFIEKSRTMMMSWFISAYCFHKMCTKPATGVVIQSQDEDRAVHDIEYMKVLWEQADKPLRDRWKLARVLDKQPYNRFELANGSWAIGIPGDPNKVRSEHPSIVLFDEAAFMTRGMESYNIAVATRAPQIICNSSAEVGWFQDICESAKPVKWPDYKMPVIEPEYDELVQRLAAQQEL